MALSDYQLVEYIQAIGSQYIDTGISPASYLNTLKIEADMQYTSYSSSTGNFLFGSGYYNSTTSNRRTIFAGSYPSGSTTKVTYLNGANISSGVSFTNSTLDTNRHIYGIDQVNKVYIFDDQTQTFSTTINSNLTKTIVLFAGLQSGTSGAPVGYYSNVRCYSFKIWDNGTLILDLRPAKRKSDLKAGMYDILSDTFYENQGSGSFIAGNNLYEISAVGTPAEGGSVTGGGYYANNTSVTLTAIPRKAYRYEFSKWSDGDTSNPRTIVVSGSDASYVAEFERTKIIVGEEYRLYGKVRTQLQDAATFYTNVQSADISEDLLQKSTSTIICYDEIPLNTGDIICIKDARDNLIYNGVIVSVDGNRMTTNQIQAMFDMKVFAMIDNATDKGYWSSPYTPLIMTSRYLRDIAGGYYSSRMASTTEYTHANGHDLMQGNMFLLTIANFEGSRPSGLNAMPYRTENGEVNGEELLYEAFEKFGIIPYFYFDIKGRGTSFFLRQFFYVFTLQQMAEDYDLGYYDYCIPAYRSLAISNNAEFIRDINVITDIEDTNVLVIYNSSGTTYRGAYTIGTDGNYQTTDGNGDLGTTDRYVPTNRKYINSDETLTEIRDTELKKNQYNHKIQFTFDLNNNFYDFGDIKLGENISFYVGDKFYDSVLTGWNFHIENGKLLESVNMVCGKVRNNLTSKLNLGKVK